MAGLLHPLVSLEWRESSKLPVDIRDAQAVVLRGKVYVGGGNIFQRSGAQSCLPSGLLIYDLAKGTWDTLRTPTKSYGLTSYHSQLVLVGGKNPTNFGHSTNRLWVLDEEHHWTEPLPPMLTKNCGASALGVGNHLIVAGGLNDELGPLDVVQIYDDHEWRMAHSLPNACYFMKSALYDGNWYLAGGVGQSRMVFHTSLESLIVATNTEEIDPTLWKKMPNVPLLKSALLVFRKQLLSVGGGDPCSSSIYAYTSYTNSWVCVADLPIVCYSTCILDLPTGELMMMGGVTDDIWSISHAVFKAKIRVTSFPEGHFTMGALDRLELAAGISIHNQLASEFLAIASALCLDDPTLGTLSDVFDRWLSGKSSLPPTWRVLLAILRDINMEELAQEIDDFFNVNRTSLPAAYILSKTTKKKEEEFESFCIEIKDQQTKPDCREVAVQISPDCQEMAVQTHDSSSGMEGVEVIGETEFTVPVQGGSFEWRGYGLKLHVPEGNLQAGMTICRVHIRVSLRGQFQLPNGSNLLSPVFWISTPCKFLKPVTLEIQHCAPREDETVLSDLSFVTARCSQEDLPYRFRFVDGGVFTTHSSYGSIQLSHFSGKGVVGRKRTPRSYCAHLYHTMKLIHDWRFYLAITQDLDAQLTAVMNHYGHFAKRDTSMKVRFERGEITPNIPENGCLTPEGWKIIPMSYPGISRKDVDDYKGGQWIPQCELMLEWRKEDRPIRLQYRVNLKGAKAPKDYFRLVLDPEEDVGITGAPRMHSTIPCKPELKDLMDALYHKVADKWEHIGMYLKLHVATLKAIATEHRCDPHICLMEMLGVWLKRVRPPATWVDIIETVEFLGEEQLGLELREQYMK